MEKVLLFFSGGNDSTLSALKLVFQGYDVQLITFDNGCEEGIENIRNRATSLKRTK
jgi:predicted subunit of tRNA(5-methylaminomethyl-2-thiouridylate) methyltransferase